MKLYAQNITDAVIAVTYACNARCQMCNIWQYRGPQPMNAAEYLKLPSSLTNVNISGGECFLRADLGDVVENIKKAAPKAKFKISTNAFATELSRKKIREILDRVPMKDIAITISVDGFGPLHDQIRGIPDGYKKVMETIQMYKDEGITDLTIAMTVGDYNYQDVITMYRESLRIGSQFTVAVLHNSDHYFQIDTNNISKTTEIQEAFLQLIRKELHSLHPKRWVRAFFAYGIVYYLSYKKRLLPNYGGQKAIFLNPDGFVYASDVAVRHMGNIKDHRTFQELLDTHEAVTAAEHESHATNWMICTARTAIKTHPLKVIYWIIKSELCPWTIRIPK